MRFEAVPYSDEDIEDFYSTLQGKVDAVPKHDILMIIDDWNVKVGKDYTSWSPTIISTVLETQMIGVNVSSSL